MPTFGETPEGVWLGEVFQNCVIETQGGNQSIDMNLLINMCKGEPQNALIALQILANEMVTRLGGKPVDEAEDFAINLRLLLGSIAMAYMISKGNFDGTVPKELMLVFNRYPVIIDCVNFVGKYNHDLKRVE